MVHFGELMHRVTIYCFILYSVILHYVILNGIFRILYGIRDYTVISCIALCYTT